MRNLHVYKWLGRTRTSLRKNLTADEQSHAAEAFAYSNAYSNNMQFAFA